MTHTAFNLVQVLDKFPLKIECVEAWVTSQHSRLVVGTFEGSLLVFDVEAAGPDGFATNPVENKKLSPKPIEKVDVLDDLNIALTLSNGTVTVHDLPAWRTRRQVATGANLYTLSYHPGGGSLLLCVAVKKKLSLFTWNFDAGNFDFIKDLAMPDNPRSVAWCDDRDLIIGFKREYNLVNVASGAMSDIFPTGPKGGEPTCLPLPTNEILLGKDNMSVFVGYNAKPTRHHALTWGDVPAGQAYAFPYVLALLPRCVEVRGTDSPALVQSIGVAKAKTLCSKGAVVYVASVHTIHRLNPVPLRIQVAELADERLYEQALELTKLIPEEDPEKKEQKLNYIRELYAYDSFVKGNYDRAMGLFLQLRIDPAHIIGMYPDLLPAELRITFAYPFNIPELEKEELDRALEALIVYLPRVRLALDKQAEAREEAAAAGGPPPAAAPGSRDFADRLELRQIIDTTLLKAYLRIQPKFISELLSSPNNCYIEECETVLREARRFPDLVLLYQSAGQHRTALELLKSMGRDTESELAGTQHTVKYLQELGGNDLALVLQYSEWVLKARPEDGLSIFTAGRPAVPLPQVPVLEHLERVAPQLVTRYLEHCVLKRNTTEPEFHTRLVMHYADAALAAIKRLPSEQMARRANQPVMATNDSGILGEARRVLLGFLETSRYYVPNKLLSQFPFDDLLEERAVLLSRIGQHEEALAIYARRLREPEMAEAYCRRTYNPDDDRAKDVWLDLLRVYLKPSEEKSVPMIAPALAILNKYNSAINIQAALDLVPPATPIERLLPFFAAVLESQAQQRRDNQVLLNLLKAEDLQYRETLIRKRSENQLIEETTKCPECNKRMGESAFWRYPNGTVIHLMCSRNKDKSVCPVTNRDFRLPLPSA